jgi:hypothetical protein
MVCWNVSFWLLSVIIYHWTVRRFVFCFSNIISQLLSKTIFLIFSWAQTLVQYGGIFLTSLIVFHWLIRVRYHSGNELQYLNLFLLHFAVSTLHIQLPFFLLLKIAFTTRTGKGKKWVGLYIPEKQRCRFCKNTRKLFSEIFSRSKRRSKHSKFS